MMLMCYLLEQVVGSKSNKVKTKALFTTPNLSGLDDIQTGLFGSIKQPDLR